jgi:2-amino-4-hydroxy-6-hydroxymethyldihydropteridine diphosphokinase
MNRVYLGLGSNVGDRLSYITKAIEELEDICDILTMSSIYETEPVGMSSTHLFLNMAVAAETAFDPPELLKQLKEIEEKLGRKQAKKKTDREIDLDILLYEGMIYRNSMVTIPHPEMEHRKFVLVPLAEIAPEIIHPVKGISFLALLQNCKDTGKILRTNYQLSFTH